MASAASVSSLVDEVSCPICQGTLREPVTIDCGHNFCRSCLTRYCEVPGPEPEESLACPLCKQPFRPAGLRPNWQLASVVDNIERLRLAPTPGLDEEDVCKEHGEKIYFFCEDDETQLCVLCREAWAHRAHTVRFLEDAAGPYREQIQKCLECLRKEREEIQRIQARENQRTQVLLSQVATKRQKVIFEFAYLSQFLEEQQSVLLAQLEALDADILRQREEFDVLVSEEMCRFGSLISELEEKNERPARGLLTGELCSCRPLGWFVRVQQESAAGRGTKHRVLCRTSEVLCSDVRPGSAGDQRLCPPSWARGFGTSRSRPSHCRGR